METTADIRIPSCPLERVIGQDRAVEKIRCAVRQRRHVLLVGPPGTGKSMLAKAMASLLPKPKEEVRVLHNPQNPERPIVQVVRKAQVKEERQKLREKLLKASEAPVSVAEVLGFRCPCCGALSKPNEDVCPRCGIEKYSRLSWTKPIDSVTEIFEVKRKGPEKEVRVTVLEGDEEKVLVYRRLNDTTIEVFEEGSGDQRLEMKVLIPLERNTFVQATGASETELLGDVRHDPYGSHPELGVPPYKRVIPGAIHEAHEGVLYIDELPRLGYLQAYLLTAMQERKFPIVGRNPHSAGASVRVDDVPCDFTLAGACNLDEIPQLLPPLRSRILGCGYEILLNTTMSYDEQSLEKFAQFVAQEIEDDGRIPHATREAVLELAKEARRRAYEIDGVRNAITLRLRDLSGIIRFAGDLAKLEGSELIGVEHMRKGIKEAKPVEKQIEERYGASWRVRDSPTGDRRNEYWGYV